jgi:hypothetical protein
VWNTADIISDGQPDASDGQPDKEVAARTALPRKLQASHETQSVHMSYTADPVSPVCEGYMCGHTYTSLCASEVELDFEGVDLVDNVSIHTYMCQMDDTIIVTKVGDVPSVRARQVLTWCTLTRNMQERRPS